MADSDALNWLAKGVRTVPIDFATSGDKTVFTATAGKRFCVYHLWLQAENVVDVTFKSGSTVISGAIAFAANAEKEWKNSGVGVFVARAASDNFVLNLGGNIQVNGFCVLSEMAA